MSELMIYFGGFIRDRPCHKTCGATCGDDGYPRCGWLPISWIYRSLHPYAPRDYGSGGLGRWQRAMAAQGHERVTNQQCVSNALTYERATSSAHRCSTGSKRLPLPPIYYCKAPLNQGFMGLLFLFCENVCTSIYMGFAQNLPT